MELVIEEKSHSQGHEMEDVYVTQMSEQFHTPAKVSTPVFVMKTPPPSPPHSHHEDVVVIKSTPPHSHHTHTPPPQPESHHSHHSHHGTPQPNVTVINTGEKIVDGGDVSNGRNGGLVVVALFWALLIALFVIIVVIIVAVLIWLAVSGTI